MAALSKIRIALADTIENGVENEINMYQNIPDIFQFPACIIRPDSCDYDGAFSRGDDVWKFDLFLIVGRADTANAAELLDEFVSGSGPSSIRAAVENNYSLGLADTSAHVCSVKGYGGGFETAKTRHIGAVIKVEIHTDGSQV